MEEYRVLLVDDEEEIREGIRRRIDWAGLGFQLAGTAGNGVDALELAEQLRPDVVLTDIKMPYMDGLELCRRLKPLLPAAKLVVFSGFDEFEYARQAIGMNVSEYILKPINAPELSGVLGRLREQLDGERMERRDIEALRRRYEERWCWRTAPPGTGCCCPPSGTSSRPGSPWPGAPSARCSTTTPWPCWSIWRLKSGSTP